MLLIITYITSIMATTFRILIIGDKGVGKTTFIKRHITGHFLDDYNPTNQVDTYQMVFRTNHQNIQFEILDTPGTINHWDGADGAFIFFSVTDIDTYRSIHDYDHEIKTFFGNSFPVVLCANKVDVGTQNRDVKPYQIQYQHMQRHRDFATYEISAKSNYNFEKPFLYMARKLTGIEDLQFY
jgi:GTP-binding nuclear protein Ran